MLTLTRPYPKTIPLTLTLVVILMLALSACGKKKDDKPEATVEPTATNSPTEPTVVEPDHTPTPSDTPTPEATATSLAPTLSFASAVFEGQNTITLADGSTATYQFNLNYPADWVAAPGSTTNYLYSHTPLTFPIMSGHLAITFNFQSFMPPDLTTIEQVVPDVPTMPIIIAGYTGIRADFTGYGDADTEGSTIVLQLDDNAFMFITLQMAVGERASVDPIALEILNSLNVVLIQN